MPRERTRARAIRSASHDRMHVPREQRRAELLAAAIVVVRREGPAATMDQIAAEAGVTKPILYRHFGDRQGLTHAVAEHFAADLLANLRGALTGPGDPHEILVTTIETFVAFIDSDPALYRFLVGGPEGAGLVADFLPQIVAEVAVVLGEGLRDAGVDSGPAEVWAHGIVGMVHLAGLAWVAKPTLPRARLVTYLADLLWQGLAGAGLAAASGPQDR